LSIRSTSIEILEALPDRNTEDEIALSETSASEQTGSTIYSAVIEEREGVPYINENVLKSGSGAESGFTLNQDFKTLVDSILRV